MRLRLHMVWRLPLCLSEHHGCLQDSRNQESAAYLRRASQSRGGREDYLHYALQCYSETTARMHQFLDAVHEFGYRSVFFEQFHLTKPETLKKMAASTQSYIMLSPESHDLEISRLAGRGTYTMEQMEEWLPRALDAGIKGIMIWFFIGMPRQTKESVRETVAY